MSEIIRKYENVFKVLHQDHSYFLTCPEELQSYQCYYRYPNSYIKRIAAVKIWNFLCSVRNRKIYLNIKTKLYNFCRQNPLRFLRKWDFMTFTYAEKDNIKLVFRLAGETFPPHVVYKIFNRLYHVRSYNFAAMNQTNNGKKSKSMLLANKEEKTYKEWKVCYIHKERNMSRKPKPGRKSNSISWIKAKYGY